MGTGHPRLTTTADPKHSNPVTPSEHDRRTRDQQVSTKRVRKDGTGQHGQTPLPGLDRRLDNRGVPVLALHPARQRTTTNAPDDKTTTVTCRVRWTLRRISCRETGAGVPEMVSLALAELAGETREGCWHGFHRHFSASLGRSGRDSRLRRT